MTGFNNSNKLVPSTPKTYTVLELRDAQQEIKKSPLSAAARSKIVNRSGSNYLSEKEGYGPCLFGNSSCSITATLIATNGKSKSRKLDRPVLSGEGGLQSWCSAIQTSE